MTIHQNILQKLAISTFLLSIPFNSAFAQDATAIADRLKAALAKQGIAITWTAVSGDASALTLEGATIKPAAEANALPIGNITLSNVTEDEGALVIDTLTTQPFSKTQDGISLNVSPIVVNGLILPAEGETDPLASILMYESLQLASMEVKVADKTAFTMNGLSMDITPPEDGKAMELEGAIEKFTADLTLIEDPQSKAAIEALGYQNINGYAEMAGSWQPSDGRMELSQYDISVEKAGTFGMTFDFGGYTVDFVKSVQELSKKLAEQPEGADNSAQGLAMLGLMQQLTINGATIRFDDDSLTGKVLDFVGKQQGMSGKDIANQAKAIVPFLTGQLNNPELAAQVTTAVGAFLDDPKNLEIAAAPSAPVPMSAIMAGAMSNPLDLTKTLGVTVTANQQ